MQIFDRGAQTKPDPDRLLSIILVRARIPEIGE
jgi:hypothetical protein